MIRHYCDRANHGTGCEVCDLYDARLSATREGRAPSFLVVAYGIDRLYGGSEEGGWYYDATSVIEVRVVYTVGGALRAARELRDDHPTCPRGRHSVLGGTDVYVSTYYSETDPRFPRTTGHPGGYE
jgi:hypothetical protein